MICRLTREQLKQKGASDFKDGDVIVVSKYAIYIKYSDGTKKYGTPSLLTRVENVDTCKFLDCTPGVGWPYYVSDFISR